jgi:hypothetical protein
VVAASHSAPRAAAAGGAQFAADGTMSLPTGYRTWVFIGAPLTPNGLNGGKADFPEFHNVYVQRAHLAAYQKTGSFREGTVIVKELVLLRPGTYPDGSADTPSGRGFAEGEFNGMDVTVKDSTRFAATNGWGFFNFGHHALPYNATAKAAPRGECAYCHAPREDAGAPDGGDGDARLAGQLFFLHPHAARARRQRSGHHAHR